MSWQKFSIFKSTEFKTYRAVSKRKSRFNLDISRMRSGDLFVKKKKKKQTKESKHNCRQEKKHTLVPIIPDCLTLERQLPAPRESSQSFGKVRPSL